MEKIEDCCFEEIEQSVSAKDYQTALQQTAYVIGKAEHSPLEEVRRVKKCLMSAVSKMFASSAETSSRSTSHAGLSTRFEARKISFHELLKVRKAKTKTVFLKEAVQSVIAAKVAIDGDDVYLMSFITEDADGRRRCLCPRRFNNLDVLLEAVSKVIEKPICLKM